MHNFTVLDIKGKASSQIVLCSPGMMGVFQGILGDNKVFLVDDKLVRLFYQRCGKDYKVKLCSLVSLEISTGSLIVFTATSFIEHDPDCESRYWSYCELLVAPYLSTRDGFRTKMLIAIVVENLGLEQVACAGHSLISRFDLSKVFDPCVIWLNDTTTSIKVENTVNGLSVENLSGEKFSLKVRNNFKTA